jgi:NAD(P) transhydrogenase subunit beta
MAAVNIFGGFLVTRRMLAMFQKSEGGVGTMDFGFTIAAYVVAAVLFILSLGGLSGRKAPNARCGTASSAWRLRSGHADRAGHRAWPMSLILIAAGAAVGYQLATRVR